MKGSALTFSREDIQSMELAFLWERLYSDGKRWFWYSARSGRVYLSRDDVEFRIHHDRTNRLKTRVRVRAGREVI
jgi:hypothetical protein